MAVEVRIPTMFRKFTANEAEIDLEPGTVGDLINQLESRYPGLKQQLVAEDGGLHRYVNVYVNDEDARYLDRLDTKVSDGDTVALLPSVAGGAPTTQ